MGVAKKVFNEEVAFAPATEHIGSEVSGIDLANPLPDSVFQQIQRELHDRSVLQAVRSVRKPCFKQLLSARTPRNICRFKYNRKRKACWCIRGFKTVPL